MPTTHDHQPTGHPPAAEPHPWGRPLPVGHPGHRPPTRLDIAATGRWLVYATALTLALTLATIVVALVAIAATQPQTTTEAPPPAPVTLGRTTTPNEQLVEGGGQALDGDRFTPIESDTSRYHGPTDALPAAASGLDQEDGR